MVVVIVVVVVVVVDVVFETVVDRRFCLASCTSCSPCGG